MITRLNSQLTSIQRHHIHTSLNRHHRRIQHPTPHRFLRHTSIRITMIRRTLRYQRITHRRTPILTSQITTSQKSPQSSINKRRLRHTPFNLNRQRTLNRRTVPRPQFPILNTIPLIRHLRSHRQLHSHRRQTLNSLSRFIINRSNHSLRSHIHIQIRPNRLRISPSRLPILHYHRTLLHLTTLHTRMSPGRTHHLIHRRTQNRLSPVIIPQQFRRIGSTTNHTNLQVNHHMRRSH